MSGRRLNHQGFSAFLQNNQSSSGGGSAKTRASSSTKEIARKAVEDEWKRNQKRKRSGRGGDSSDEEDDHWRDRGKFQRKQQRTEEEEDDIFEFSQDYRDRAKERREGKPPANTDSDGKDESKDQMDPVLPPPTKGLDVSLARKLRNEIKENSDGKKASDDPMIFTKLPTMEEATITLESIASEDNQSSSSTMIDSNTLDYIGGLVKMKKNSTQMPKTISCTLAGKKLQRSRLVVNLNVNTSDLKRSWEIPREVTNSNSSSNNVQPSLDLSLIRKIEAILKPMNKSHNQAARSSSKTKLKKSTQGSDKVDARKFSPRITLKTTQEKEAQVSDDDDDDIFKDLDDYVPQAPKVKQ